MRGAPIGPRRWASRPMDHPRRCGEHRSSSLTLDFDGGSSPQMRGARFFRLSPALPNRIIPADAGSTHHPPRCNASRTDHPRRCGEHSSASALESSIYGSSPQMRGARPSGGWTSVQHRIIPADAGSTARSLQSHSAARDHPRRCGEHLTDNLKGDVEQGSSPQMRGARAHRQSS